MAFLGGLFGGGSKTTVSSTTTTGTNVDNAVGVDVSATISPTISPTIAPVINNAVDLTGIGEAVGKVAGVLDMVAGSLAKSQAATAEKAQAVEKKESAFLDNLGKLGGAATAILAMLAIFFALKDPANVKVQL